MKLVDQIQVNIKQIGQENDRIKFDNMLSKKINSVEYLGKILIKQEKEFITIQKQQSKSFKKLGIVKDQATPKDKNEQYELESLLNESSSDEENQKSDSEEEEETNAEPVTIQELEDWAESEDIESGNQLLMTLDNDSKDQERTDAFQKQMLQRTEQISNVTQSIGKI